MSIETARNDFNQRWNLHYLLNSLPVEGAVRRQEFIDRYFIPLRERIYIPNVDTQAIIALSGPPELTEDGEYNERSHDNVYRIIWASYLAAVVTAKKLNRKSILDLKEDELVKYAPLVILNGEGRGENDRDTHEVQLEAMNAISKSSDLITFIPVKNIVNMGCGVRGEASTLSHFESIQEYYNKYGLTHITLVTTGYHVPRVACTADKLLTRDTDFDVVGVPWSICKYDLRWEEVEAGKIDKYSMQGDISAKPSRGLEYLHLFQNPF